MKTQHLFFFIVAYSVLFYIQPCLSFSLNSKLPPTSFLILTFNQGTMITDLTSTTSADFQTESSAWMISNAVNACPTCNIYTTPPNSCGIDQEIIYGGPGVLGTSEGASQLNEYYSRYYDSLNFPDTPTALEFDLWIFCNFVPGSPNTDSLYAVFDSGSGTVTKFDAVLVSSCELDYIDAGGVVIKAFYKFRVRFLYSHADDDTLLITLFSQFTVASTVASFGVRNFQSYIDSTISIDSPISEANFPCLADYYWTGSACAPCSTECSVCYGSTHNECTVCNDGYFNYGNGTCLETCDDPFEAVTNDSVLYCEPKCETDFFWYYNSSCSPTCDSPLFSGVDANGLKICSNPCYYDDVNSAYVNKYLYPDQTCGSTCPSSLVKSSPGLCLGPCTNSQCYYYEVDQKCLATCADPYEPEVFHTVKICYLSENLNAQEVQDTKDMVAGLTTANKAGAIGAKASASLSSTSPALAFLAGQVSMLFSIRYIDVGYPDKVKLMFKLQGASPFSLSINFDIPDGIERKLVNKSPPAIFEEYEVPSKFLENSWDTLMTLMLTLFGILMLVVLKKMMKGKIAIIERILGGLLSFLKWNIPLMIFCSSFGDMYFFASLQFQTGISRGTAWEIISFLLAIFMILIGVGIIMISVKIARDIMKNKEAEEKWENFELLFGGQKRTSILSFCYMAFYLGVTIISNLIFANLYAYPLCEALLVTMISLVMFLFLVIQRPLKEHKMFIQVIVNQLLLVVVNICVVILAIMDELDIEKQDIRDKVGQGITLIFFFSMASGIGFAGLDLLFALFSLYKFMKKLKAEGKLSFKGIFNALVYGGLAENGKVELERTQPVKRQSTDLSLGLEGKISLQPPRKGKNPQNPLNISYQDSNISGMNLIHNQNSDSSFDISGSSFLSRGQQQRFNKINRRISQQRSEFSVETINHSPRRRPPPQRGFASTVEQKIKQKMTIQPHGNEKRVQNISNIANISSPKSKRRINLSIPQSQLHLQHPSYFLKRKNQTQTKKKLSKQSEGN